MEAPSGQLLLLSCSHPDLAANYFLLKPLGSAATQFRGTTQARSCSCVVRRPARRVSTLHRLLPTRLYSPSCLVSGTGIPIGDQFPAGNGDGRKLSPDGLHGDGDGEIFSPRGWGWWVNPRRGIPHCHLGGAPCTHQDQVRVLPKFNLPSNFRN